MLQRLLSKKINGIFVLLIVFSLSLTGCGKDKKSDDNKSTAETVTETTASTEDDPTTEVSEDTTSDTTEDNTEASSEEGSTKDNIADSSDMAEVEDVVDENMTPITADMLNDGVYDIDVASSSSMFKIISASLTVSEGKLTVVMTMSSKGYLYVYTGTPEEAAAADESLYIPFAEDDEGNHTFTVEIPSLDSEVKCAAFSKKKEKWYDRSLCFLSGKLPVEAFKEGTLATAEKLGLTDGVYSADVKLAGGSGKASVESPAIITIDKDGNIYATIVWSSSNYDYMIVNGEKIEAEIIDDHSTFKIPVTAFDYRQSVIADTTAMSKPYEITYSLRFDSKSIVNHLED